MISSRRSRADGTFQFVIRPNQSLNWRHAKIFMAVITALSLAIATGFTALGFWPILPFAGLELTGLASALYVCALGNRRCQVVTVESRRITVEKGNNKPEETWVFAREWTRILLEKGRHNWYPKRLLIRSRGRRLEIGEFLNEEEREQLAGRLGAAIKDVAMG